MTARQQLALVPAEALAARDIQDGIGILQSSSDFMAIANSVWDFRLDFFKGLQHIGAVLRHLVDRSDVSEAGIGAFVGVWYVKAKLRPDTPQPPRLVLPRVALVAAANGPPPSPLACARLWQVFLELVTFELGEDFSEATLHEAVKQLAEEAADSDAQLNADGVRGTPMQDRLLAGLPESSARTQFRSAYGVRRGPLRTL